MTVAALYAILGNMIADGHGRKPMAVYKSTFTHPLEGDGVAMMEPSGCVIQHIPLIGDDGGMVTRADGSESMRAFAVLYGAIGSLDENGSVKCDAVPAAHLVGCGSSCGRSYLSVNGHVVSFEGAFCPDADLKKAFQSENWTEEMIRKVCDRD